VSAAARGALANPGERPVVNWISVMLALARFRPAGWLVLAVWLIGALAPMAGAVHQLGDDPACQKPGLASHPTTQFESLATIGQHDHCVVCHFQRTLRSASPLASLLAPAAGPAPIPILVTADQQRSASIATLPSRAPPSLS
jgi:hypothetical protein